MERGWAVAVESGLEVAVTVRVGGKVGKVVGFTAGKVGGLADVAFLVGGIEDAVNADHGKNEPFLSNLINLVSNFRLYIYRFLIADKT